jgi:hypothetical protein
MYCFWELHCIPIRSHYISTDLLLFHYLEKHLILRLLLAICRRTFIWVQCIAWDRKSILYRFLASPILFQYSSLSLCHSNEIKQHARVCFSIFSFDLKSFCFPFFLFGRGERSQTNEKPNHKIRKNPDERANKPKRKDTHTQVPSITKDNN